VRDRTRDPLSPRFWRITGFIAVVEAQPGVEHVNWIFTLMHRGARV
jgi:hypothetical protein